MQWNIKETPDQDKVNQLAEALQIDLILAKLLVLRGIETFEQAKSFFRPNLDDLHDPFLMKGMQTAVERIEKAMADGENILIYGDYDVDGTTAVSLVYNYLSKIGANVATYIPDRYKEGYGISLQGIDFASDNNFDLIIALDCGIKAIDQVVYAKSKKIDFIICDHHRPGEKIPEAIAILNPKQKDCNYPYKELCGCGIGFKLIQTIHQKNGGGFDEIIPYLDLVVTAIGADIVPMTGENRVLASFGLQVINQAPSVGIQALIEHVKKPTLTITDVVFIIAPRINAAGRMKSGIHAVELLTSEDPLVARKIAADIEKYNRDRKELDQKITQEALFQIEENNEKEDYTTVVFQEDWHKGVIGIVASRIMETYYRPTLVFTQSGDHIAGSARSVKGFDIYAAIDACSEHIVQFGGHKYAAGLTLKRENYQKFKEQFENVVKTTIDPKLLTPVIAIDTEIELVEITPKFNRILKLFAPFGPQNMKPVFITSGLRDNGYGKLVGDAKAHLKLSLINGSDHKTYNAIGFNLAHKEPVIKNGQSFSIAYTLEENQWNGITSLQLNLKDLK